MHFDKKKSGNGYLKDLPSLIWKTNTRQPELCRLQR